MEPILIYGLCLYGYTCILATAVNIGRSGCTEEALGNTLCMCVLLPFYPVILPFFIPYYYYCEYRVNRESREGRRNDNRSGYDGFQERTDNIVNEDSNNTNINEN